MIKKLNEDAFIRQTFFLFRSCTKVKYEWVKFEDGVMNVTFFNNEDDAKEIAENLNQDEEGNKIEVCEVKCLALFDPFSL